MAADVDVPVRIVGALRLRVRVIKFARIPRDPIRVSECDIAYRDPVPNFFSFNSPIGACEICRGFGRSIGIDYDLVIPDESKTLCQGAIKPWQTQSYASCDSVCRGEVRRRYRTSLWVYTTSGR